MPENGDRGARDTGGEIFVEDSRLLRYAENCAAEVYSRAVKKRGAPGLLRMLKKNIGRYRAFAGRVESFTAGHSFEFRGNMPPEFEWITDNEYLISKEGRELAQLLRCRTRFAHGGEDGRFPSVFLLAESLLNSGAGGLTPERAAAFIGYAQNAADIGEEEFNFFIPMLKCAAILRVCALAREAEAVLEGYERPTEKNPFSAELLLRRTYESGKVPDKKLSLYASTARSIHDHTAQGLKAAFDVLRKVGGVAYEKAIGGQSALERLLSEDPAGVYPQMDERSRSYYRHLAVRIAKREKQRETELARDLLDRAREHGGDEKKGHVGHWLLNSPRILERRSRLAGLYLYLDVFLPLAAGAVLAIIFKSLWLFPAAAITLWEPSRAALIYLFRRIAPVNHVPALELKDGVPEDGAAICVIALLCDSEKTIKEHMDKLLRYHLANRDAGEHVCYGILADFPDSAAEEDEKDAALLACGRECADRLNGGYGRRFCFISRRRVWGESEGVYMGYERKRGAVMSLCGLALGTGGDCEVYGLPPERLEKTRYIVTLDSDTALTPGSLVKMVGAMLHPENRAEADEEKRCVTSGYGILQPRICADLRSANASVFSRIFAGQGGTDPYSHSSGELYFDLFGESIFIGKGIIDAHAAHACLEGTIPDGAVLSHDLLEGSFLRCAYLPAAELPDGFPASVRSYYKRMGRWVRGDVQLIPWLCGKIRMRDGKKIKNPLSGISKVKIADNLRRIFTPAVCLLAFAVFAITRSGAAGAAAVCALLALGAPLLLNGVERIRNFGNKITTRCHSTIYAGFRGGLMLCVSRFLLLPFEAWVCVKSAVRALWRMLVSKKKLLEWITAAEAEKMRSKGLLGQYLIMAANAVTAAAVILLGMNPVAAVFAFFFLLAPAYAEFISKRADIPYEFSQGDRAWLFERAGEIWKYFERHICEEENFLPPDNLQEEPCGITAHRTSPTNIGLALVSAVCAARLGLCTENRAVELIGKILSAMEGLQRFRGHFFNWYDTRTMGALAPATISSVDSGNLAACLAAAGKWLEKSRAEGAPELAGLCEKLWSEMDFRAVYDEARQLFHISLDPETGRAEGYYDMLASEARLTSYFAVAKGDVPHTHWQRLARSLAENNGYSGLVSWSGSLFEYLMPNLLMPDIPNSLLYESGKFAVYCQRERGRQTKTPWGISESAYFAFDSSLVYQYKAHGAAVLALKPGMDSELVVSPYSSYLALLTEPAKALSNLKRLRTEFEYGEFGLYEAIDFTAGRLPTGEGRRVIKTYMTHHLGMSLCAIANILAREGETGFLNALFMSLPGHGAYESLLCERVPVNAVNIRRPSRQKPGRGREPELEGYEFTTEEFSGLFEPCNLFHNSGCGTAAFAGGGTAFRVGELSVYRSVRLPGPDGSRLSGVMFFLKSRGRAHSLMGDGLLKKCVFTDGAAKYICEAGNLLISRRVRICSDETGELWEITLKNRGEAPERLELCAYLEPILCREQDFESHPDFMRMLIGSGQSEGGALFSRRDRSGKGDIFLSALTDGQGAKFTAGRQGVLGRGGYRDPERFFENPELCEFGELKESALRMLFSAELAPGEKRILRIALSVGKNRVSTELCAKRMLLEPASRKSEGFLQNARTLGIGRGQLKDALWLAAALETGFGVPGARRAAPDQNSALPGRAELWRLGISGDLPVAAIDASEFTREQDFIRECFKYIRLHSLLYSAGEKFDLAIVFSDGGRYERPLHSACASALQASASLALLGKKGGVHLLDSALQNDPVKTLLACGALFLPAQEEKRFRAGALPPMAKSPPPSNKRAFSQPLCTEEFGCLSVDAGLTHIWRKNSRLFRVTPWEDDMLMSAPEFEEISVADGDGRVSLFCGGGGGEAKADFAMGKTVWTKELGGGAVSRTTAFVCPDRPMRVVTVELDLPDGQERELFWVLRPLLGERLGERRSLVTEYDAESGVLTARNPMSGTNPDIGLACVSYGGEAEPTCDYEGFLSGEFRAAAGYGTNACMAFKIRVRPENGKAKLRLCAAADGPERAKALVLSMGEEGAAERELQNAVRAAGALLRRVRVTTPDSVLDRYINEYNPRQIYLSRLWSRSSLYQNGGAYGFRDQLQDASALLLTDPEALRRQILRCCAHQYTQGDVMHWFHFGIKGLHRRKMGVRTNCSDDLLWLPWAVCEYLEATGDAGLLDIPVPYIESEPLSPGEHSRYETPAVSGTRESVYAHCMRVFDMFEERGAGAHGLPKILGGDWNDGLDSIGDEGRGESVWLAWFASGTAQRFSKICQSRGKDEDFARIFALGSASLAAARAAWDGQWYLRAYDDDGKPVGSAENSQCRIDSISQSFSWLCGAEAEGEDAARRKLALESAIEKLADRESGVIRLFTPPVTDRKYGYIAAYPPGVRENGGQYTHAAIWLAIAAFRAGRAREGYGLLSMLLPENHDLRVYGGEPFVLAADVYSEGALKGVCGWSWYTGAAGWYRRAVLEELLGLRLEKNMLKISPRVPEDWPGFTVEFRAGKSKYIIRAGRTAGEKDPEILLDRSGGIYEIDLLI